MRDGSVLQKHNAPAKKFGGDGCNNRNCGFGCCVHEATVSADEDGTDHVTYSGREVRPDVVNDESCQQQLLYGESRTQRIDCGESVTQSFESGAQQPTFQKFITLFGHQILVCEHSS
jgi:hypothetical protein